MDENEIKQLKARAEAAELELVLVDHAKAERAISDNSYAAKIVQNIVYGFVALVAASIIAAFVAIGFNPQ